MNQMLFRHEIENSMKERILHTLLYSTMVDYLNVKATKVSEMHKISEENQRSSVRPKGGRPAVISREKILTAAKQIDSRELTMNAVAQALDVNKASLYYHFRSRQELIGSLCAGLLSELQIPAPAPANWRHWLKEAATRLFDTLCSNPVFLELDNLSRFAQAGLPLQETALETLEEAGFPLPDAVHIWRLISGYVYLAATNMLETRTEAIKELKQELPRMLEEAERIRPMPRVRSLMALGSQRDPRHRFEETLAFQVRALPEPETATHQDIAPEGAC
jgi:TetR/AcrR family tetracycline transcriptional repressor